MTQGFNDSMTLWFYHSMMAGCTSRKERRSSGTNTTLGLAQRSGHGWASGSLSCWGAPSPQPARVGARWALRSLPVHSVILWFYDTRDAGLGSGCPTACWYDAQWLIWYLCAGVVLLNEKNKWLIFFLSQSQRACKTLSVSYYTQVHGHL